MLRSNRTAPCHILISESFIIQVLCHMRLHIPGSMSWDLDIQGNAAVLDIQGNAAILDIQGNTTILDIKGNAIFSPYLLIRLAALGCSTETHSHGF